ncbi:UNKNOWN [Stylonychia lemnae]|uniref:Uncharacterized protein n=1 Tax=Stylonychia lemnae TaxID=5949 RepID=A0A078AU01_STYLE|nr:UNKNOWN [Stylonychia lemnae]|eukprot:CDW85734.1 UNKNOWN [Stylonychia lemnae]
MKTATTVNHHFQRADEPEQLLEGMADYFALQTHSAKENPNFTPSKNNGWKVISKAIFNQQAPQHKIFRENLKKIAHYDENGRLISSRDTQYERNFHNTHLDHSHQYDDNKENSDIQNFIYRNQHNKKMVSYIHKTKQKLQTLNDMKSQLDTFKTDKSWYETMLKPKRMLKERDQNQIQAQKNTLSLERNSDDESDNDLQEKKAQQLLKQQKIQNMIQRFYSHTTKSFEAKKLESTQFNQKSEQNLMQKRRFSHFAGKIQSSNSSRMILVESRPMENKTHLETISERPVSNLEKINSRKFSQRRHPINLDDHSLGRNRPKSCDLRIKKFKKIDKLIQQTHTQQQQK